MQFLETQFEWGSLTARLRLLKTNSQVDRGWLQVEYCCVKHEELTLSL